MCFYYLHELEFAAKSEKTKTVLTSVISLLTVDNT